MSKVAIKGNASGTGTFTIAAPNSNTDRTLTLPDEAGTVLTSASSIPVANLDSAVGITGVDEWRITANLSNPADDADITTNWERADNFYDGYPVGTGMTEASGIFTFPATGQWLMLLRSEINNTSGSVAYAGFEMYVSQDSGSSWTEYTRALKYIYDFTTTEYNFVTTHGVVNVSNASTYRCKFRTRNPSGGLTYIGNISETKTGVTFIRLAEAV